MRKKKLLKNTITSTLLQITTILCGFILPRLILQNYGSETNGLINSIAQFLSIINLLDLGMGSVVQSSLYKPLADNDNCLINKIITSSDKFFRRIAFILLGYIIVLIISYPYITETSFDYLYTATLIISMGISSIAQYFWGMTDRLFLAADQKGYIFSSVQMVAVIINTIVNAVLIQLGVSIHVVKLTTSLIYIIRPIIIRNYLNRHYKITRKVNYEQEPIQQKWNGIAQHISYFILEGTDSIVLTLFASLSDVSIYSVYNLVINGIKSLFTSMLAGFRSLLGELWAKKDDDLLEKYYLLMEWIVHFMAVFLWGCTLRLIMPFVEVYTKGIIDVNYIVPSFAFLIVMANALHSLRTPYNIMILATGHYKQTQVCYVIAAILNIVISILMVNICGLIGVAIGTLIAMGYQTIWMAHYCYKNLIKTSFAKLVKQIFVDIISLVIFWSISSVFKMQDVSYFSFFVVCIEVGTVAVMILGIINLVFYQDRIKLLLNRVR